ncbi:MAG: MBL fold metallo-hydrolase [Deltaproteobacteria bacterium]|nr:MBL fold metallo-hydrolase [Deltaproteobacteria bacterium]
MKKLFLLFVLLSSCSPLPDLPQERTSGSSETGDNSGKTDAILRIVALDVGQGDATLLISLSGKTVLIDAGPLGSGKNRIIPYLEEAGIGKIDLLFVSHYDGDHIGGLFDLLPGRDGTLGTDDDWVPTDGIWDRGNNSAEDKAFYAGYRSLTGPWRREIPPGQQWPLGEMTISTPLINGKYEDGLSLTLPQEDENGRSAVLLIEFGNFRYLTTGDLTGGGPSGITETTDLETRLGELVGDIDLLHLGHHGSQTSTHENFLKTLKPEAVIISVGKENDYGHPHPAVLKRLEERGIPAYRTDQMGTIEIDVNEKGYSITGENE